MRSRRGIGRLAAAVVVVIMIAMVVGLGTLFSSQGLPPRTITQSTSAAPAGCAFASDQVLQVSSTLSASFAGCLTAGTSGNYSIEATDPDGLTLTGTISAGSPIRIDIVGAKVGTLYGSSGKVYASNDTTSASFAGLVLLPQNGYVIAVTNLGGQNDTVSMSLQFNDIPGGRQ